MNVLIVGSGKGSWQVRGLQLGQAIDARVKRVPMPDDLAWADVVVCVKRSIYEFAQIVHQTHKPLVWDALDFWQQPEQNALSEVDACALLQREITRTMPTLTIGATQAMAQACGGVYLPHHARPGLEPAPITEGSALTVGYEGTRKYIGRWGHALKTECARRGWMFVVNPKDYRAIDIVVALRDAEHDGWMCREWKSGVKLVNALAAGRPIITQASAADREISTSHGTFIVSEPYRIATALDVSGADAHRRATLGQAIDASKAFSLPVVAARYRSMLSAVVNQRVAA
jgi:hypothetical protein